MILHSQMCHISFYVYFLVYRSLLRSSGRKSTCKQRQKDTTTPIVVSGYVCHAHHSMGNEQWAYIYRLQKYQGGKVANLVASLSPYF